MTDSKENFERVASYLDGQDVQLTDSQRRLAEEISSDEQHLSSMMELSVPADALDKAIKRAEYHCKPVHWKRVRFAFYGGVQAAAVLVIAIGLGRLLNPDYGFLPNWGLTYQQAMGLWQPEETPTTTTQTADSSADPLSETVKFDQALMGVLEDIVQDDADGQINEADWLEWFENGNSRNSLGMTLDEKVS